MTRRISRARFMSLSLASSEKPRSELTQHDRVQIHRVCFDHGLLEAGMSAQERGISRAVEKDLHSCQSSGSCRRCSRRDRSNSSASSNVQAPASSSRSAYRFLGSLTPTRSRSIPTTALLILMPSVRARSRMARSTSGGSFRIVTALVRSCFFFLHHSDSSLASPR